MPAKYPGKFPDHYFTQHTAMNHRRSETVSDVVQHLHNALAKGVYRSLFESASVGLALFDHEYHDCVLANDCCHRILRCSSALIRGMPLVEMINTEDRMRVRKLLQNFYRGARDNFYEELRLHRFDGTVVWVNLRLSHTGSSLEPGYDVAVLDDITERIEDRESLTYLAEHDSLTGLPNRILFLDRLESALARSRRSRHRIGLLYLDLDAFKPVNDRYGHQIGDRLLKAVSERLLEVTREVDTVSRLGGDEFAVILENLSARHIATAISAKIKKALNEPFIIDGHSLRIGVSIGLAIYPDDAADIEQLIRKSDLSMYRDKHRLNRSDSQNIP